MQFNQDMKKSNDVQVYRYFRHMNVKMVLLVFVLFLSFEFSSPFDLMFDVVFSTLLHNYRTVEELENKILQQLKIR